MSSKGYLNPPVLLPDGKQELQYKLSRIADAILIEAEKLAHKDGHSFIDKTYIKKASKRIKILSNSKMVWALRIALILMVPSIFNQIGILRSQEISKISVGLQNSLWLLPIFSIVLILFLSYAFKDFIF